MNENDCIHNVLQELENTKFPRISSRKNISNESIEAFVLGDVCYRGQKTLNGKTRGESRFNKKFKNLFIFLKTLIQLYCPNFEYTTIQINKNLKSPPHIDKNNIGYSYIIGLGNYIGGNLVIEGKEYDIHNIFLKFDGNLGHWTTDFQGTRYSVIYFTHTFKPPNPKLRKIKVYFDGIYDKEKKIKSYPYG
jgi:hypothetical protein